MIGRNAVSAIDSAFYADLSPLWKLYATMTFYNISKVALRVPLIDYLGELFFETVQLTETVRVIRAMRKTSGHLYKGSTLSELNG